MTLALQIPITDPVLLFGVVLALVLIAPLFAEKLRLPGLVGLILAGILFGPYGMGLLELEAEIRLLGQIGIVYIVFLAGLEIDLAQFFMLRYQNTVFGFFTFVIPLTMGILLAVPLLGMSMLQAVLLASMFSSHTLLTWGRVSSLGLTRNPAVIASVGGTIFTDTLALLLLAFVVRAHAGQLDALFILKLTGVIVATIGGLVFILSVLSRWFFHRFAQNGQVEYVYVLCMVFLSAALAHEAGLEPIIGAFFAGLVLNRHIPERSTLMNRIHFLGNALFIPFFLLSVGMLVDIRNFFTSGPALAVTAFMVVTALVSKLAAAVVSGRILHWSAVETLLVYGISVNQAAATLAAVMVGVRVGIFGMDVVTGTIGMIIVTCIVGGFVTDRAGRALAQSALKSSLKAPSASGLMVAMRGDGSFLIETARLMQDPSGTRPLYLLHVREADAPEIPEPLEPALLNAAASAMPVVPVSRVAVHAGAGIADSIRDFDVETVLCGLPPPRLRLFSTFGSTMDHVVSHSFCTLVLIRSETLRFSDVEMIIWPFLPAHPGFERAFGTVWRFVRQLSVPVQIRMSAEERSRVASLTGTQRIRFLDLEKPVSLSDSPNRLRIFFMVRNQGIGWRPFHQRLQKRLVSYYREPLCFVFLPEPEIDGAEDTIPIEAPENIWVSGGEFENSDIACAIPALLKEASVSSEWEKKLVEQCRRDPVELAPGICFLHAHVEGLAKNCLLVGRNLGGFEVSGLQQTKILCILLGPIDAPSRAHLMLLAALSRALRDKNLQTDLMESPVLAEALHSFETRVAEQLHILAARSSADSTLDSGDQV